MTDLSVEIDGLALDTSRTGAGKVVGESRAAPRGYALATLSLLCVLALLGLGIVMLCSVTEASGSMARAQRQALYALAGIGVLVVALRVPYRRLCAASGVFYGLAVLALLLLLVVGEKRNGAIRWYAIGPITVQPSEFARLALIWLLAWYLPRYHERLCKVGPGLIVPLVLIGVLCVLVIRQPDFGMTALLGGVGGTMLLVGGRQVRLLLLVGVFAVAGFFLLVRLDTKRWERVQVFIRRGELVEDGQTKSGGTALMAGGPWGRGLGKSFHKHKYLAEADNDFIFPIIGEELGLPATLGIVSAFLILTAAGTIAAVCASDMMGFLLATGLTVNLSTQALLNIAVVTGLVPNKGLPLPFVSAGGSNLLMQMAAVGMLLNVYITGRREKARSRAAAGPDTVEEVNW